MNNMRTTMAAMVGLSLAAPFSSAQQRIYGSAAAEGVVIRHMPLPVAAPSAQPAPNEDVNLDGAEQQSAHVAVPMLPAGYRQYAVRPWYTQPYRYYSNYRPWYTYGLYGPAYYRYHYAPSYYGYPGPYYAPYYYLRPGYQTYPAYNYAAPYVAGCYYW